MLFCLLYFQKDRKNWATQQRWSRSEACVLFIKNNLKKNEVFCTATIASTFFVGDEGNETKRRRNYPEFSSSPLGLSCFHPCRAKCCSSFPSSLCPFHPFSRSCCLLLSFSWWQLCPSCLTFPFCQPSLLSLQLSHSLTIRCVDV